MEDRLQCMEDAINRFFEAAGGALSVKDVDLIHEIYDKVYTKISAEQE